MRLALVAGRLVQSTGNIGYNKIQDKLVVTTCKRRNN